MTGTTTVAFGNHGRMLRVDYWIDRYPGNYKGDPGGYEFLIEAIRRNGKQITRASFERTVPLIEDDVFQNAKGRI